MCIFIHCTVCESAHHSFPVDTGRYGDINSDLLLLRPPKCCNRLTSLKRTG